MADLIRWFEDINIKDIQLVGGKSASLGELYQKLDSKGVNVPNGFAITTEAYSQFIEQAGIQEEIQSILSDLNTDNIHNLQRRGHKVRELIRTQPLPREVKQAITENYRKLEQ